MGTQPAAAAVEQGQAGNAHEPVGAGGDHRDQGDPRVRGAERGVERLCGRHPAGVRAALERAERRGRVDGCLHLALQGRDRSSLRHRLDPGAGRSAAREEGHVCIMDGADEAGEVRAAAGNPARSGGRGPRALERQGVKGLRREWRDGIGRRRGQRGDLPRTGHRHGVGPGVSVRGCHLDNDVVLDPPTGSPGNRRHRGSASAGLSRVAVAPVSFSVAVTVICVTV